MQESIQQNDIWMVNLGQECSKGHEQKGTRPFYVISSTEYNTKSRTPVGFFMSTSFKKSQNRFTVKIDMQGVDEYINVSQIRTLSNLRFFKKIGYGTYEDLEKMLEKFNEVIL